MKIFKMQKSACIVILDYNVDDSHGVFLSMKIIIVSVYDRLFLRKVKFLFKLSRGLTPQYYFGELRAQK